MKVSTIIAYRLLNQGLLTAEYKSPEILLNHMVAMQAQEFGPARWAIGLRVKGATDEAVNELFNQGKILRTHLLRPTWHFVSPENIRCLVQLTAPHISRMSKYYHRQQGLDVTLFKKTSKILGKALSGKNFLTRSEIEAVFTKNKIQAKGIALGYILMDAELNCLICSGPRRNNQFTYALIDEIVPDTKQPSREEAITLLLSQFIKSRGPISVQDFCYWSGLTQKDAKSGLANIIDRLHEFEYNGHQHYIFEEQLRSDSEINALLKKHVTRSTILLPDYDEYLMSYRDKSLLQPVKKISLDNSVMYNRMIIHQGRICAAWRKPANEPEISYNFHADSKVPAAILSAIKRSAKQYLKFIGED